jgi:hypothetical protein
MDRRYSEAYERLCAAERDMREGRCDYRTVQRLADEARKARVETDYSPPDFERTKQISEETLLDLHERAEWAKRKLSSSDGKIVH